VKHLLLSAMVAAAVTIWGPHSISDIGAHIMRAGILLVQFGLALDPPRPHCPGYDAGEMDEPLPYIEQARA
jgi:hypothetical protein